MISDYFDDEKELYSQQKLLKYKTIFCFEKIFASTKDSLQLNTYENPGLAKETTLLPKEIVKERFFVKMEKEVRKSVNINKEENFENIKNLAIRNANANGSTTEFMLIPTKPTSSKV